MSSSPSHFIWSSAAVYNGSVYIGNASFGDCPLVQGQLVQMNASTGAIQHVFNVVPNGCTGGGVWGSPTVDTTNGFVYFATGNPGSCTSHYTEAVIKVYASNVSIAVDSWQVRGSDNVDLDFGSTPTLFTATINGVIHQMVGIGNKDGMYYALDRNAMSHGTLWRANISHTGNCPQCGSGTISPSAWDGGRLYVAGGTTSINGVSCAGSLSALSPTGSFIWRHCLVSPLSDRADTSRVSARLMGRRSSAIKIPQLDPIFGALPLSATASSLRATRTGPSTLLGSRGRRMGLAACSNKTFL